MKHLLTALKKHLRADVSGLTCPFSRLLTAGCFHTYCLLIRNLPGDGGIAACVGNAQLCNSVVKLIQPADVIQAKHTTQLAIVQQALESKRKREKMNSNAKMGSRIYLSPPKVVWTWHRLLVYGARGRNCPASMRSCLETCRMFLTRPGTWPSTATS